MSSAKRKTGKDKLASKETKERDIARLLREGDVTHPVGETVIFDSTTRLGEAMAVVVRYIDTSFNIQQRLVHLQLLAIAKSLKGEEIAREIIATISTQYIWHFFKPCGCNDARQGSV